MHEHENCQDLLGELCDYVDGTAAEAVCAEIERHLKECPKCRCVVDTLRKTISLYQTQEGAVRLPEDVHRRLVHQLHLEDLIPDD
jgi:predicted anti-sigma-YlaC factor YlaD